MPSSPEPAGSLLTPSVRASRKSLVTVAILEAPALTHRRRLVLDIINLFTRMVQVLMLQQRRK